MEMNFASRTITMRASDTFSIAAHIMINWEEKSDKDKGGGASFACLGERLRETFGSLGWLDASCSRQDIRREEAGRAKLDSFVLSFDPFMEGV